LYARAIAALPRTLILEHAEHEGPGLLGDALGAVERRFRDPPASVEKWDLVVAMGGPMDAWDDARHPWLALEARLLAQAARDGKWVLGVCLGAQLLARGLGARVYRGANGPELGIAPIALTPDGTRDPLLAPLDGKDVLHWHSDTFDLPAGATLLASTARYPHQAFRVGARAWGVQFHFECGADMRADWAARGADELRAAGVDPASLAGDPSLDARGRAFAATLAHMSALR
jgi:GMP synthase (glutamine-hydrolysing)